MKSSDDKMTEEERLAWEEEWAREEWEREQREWQQRIFEEEYYRENPHG